MVELLDSIVEWLRVSVDSPWLWLVLFMIIAANPLVPFLPSRSAVVAVAVLVAADPGRLALLTVLTAVGALAGDCLGYWVGRRASRILVRLQRSERGRRRYEWARRATHRHASVLIIAGRHLPGGRLAGALTPGCVSYPFRRFVGLDALGASIWAVYSIAVGYLGGISFASDPLKGLLLGFGIALIVPAFAELARRRWEHRQSVSAQRATANLEGTTDNGATDAVLRSTPDRYSDG